MLISRRYFIPLSLFLLIALACGPGSRLTALTETPTAAPTATTPPTATPLARVTSAAPTAMPQPAAGEQLPLASVVEIWALDANNEPMWTGSGSIVDATGYILTNAHVVMPDKEFPPIASLLISVTQKEDEPPVPKYLAEVAVADMDLDLAVLRIIADADGNPIPPNSLDLPAIPLGNSDEAHLGTPLRILGYPGIGGDTITLTTGEIAGFTSEPGVKGRAFIKTSATIAGGNSGGAGLTPDGELIAVPTQLGAGGGADSEIVDCRRLTDTNDDGFVDERDACVPGGGFINALRPINLAKPLLARALAGATEPRPTAEPDRSPVSLPDNAGEILYADDFSSDKGDWGIIDGIVLDGQELQIEVPEINNYIWTTIAETFDDFDYQIEGRKLGGPDNNSYGVVYRFLDENNFYTFEVSSDGFYVINRFENGEWISLTDWKSSPLVNTGFGTNVVEVEGIGSLYKFYINGVLVETLSDDAFSGGTIGVIVSSYSEPDVSVAFDNALVRVPGGAHQAVGSPSSDDTGMTQVLADDFSFAASSEWNLEDSEKVERDIADGVFSLRINAPNTDGWSSYPQNFADVVVEVDAAKIAGPDVNNYGVLCQYQDSDNYYFLQLGSDGTYAISRNLGGDVTMLVDWTPSAEILTGSATNRIRAECRDGMLGLYVNGTQLALVEDDTFTSGRIALGAGTYDEAGVQVNFDNLVVKSTASQTESGGGEFLFFDDFSANTNDWTESDDADAAYFFGDGEYYLQTKADNYLIWSRVGRTFDAVVIDVDAREVAGPDDNEFGVMCRYQDADNFYQFGISGDGYYRLAGYIGGEFTEFVAWDTSSSIFQGQDTNHITAICDGTRLEFRVNGDLLLQYDDASLPVSGDVALFSGTYDVPDVTIAFDNLSITRP